MQCNLEKSEMNTGKRRSDLFELNSYIQAVDNDVTMILQSLQWDRKHLIEASVMVSCQYNQNHRVPSNKLRDHEKECYLRSLGYSKEDLLLPEPLDEKANTLVTLNKNDIANIIEYAAKVDPGFKKGRGGEPTGLLSLERLQHAYSADERRALHDATVSAAPACHDLGELALLGGDDEAHSSKQKSRAEILSELRDMKRRRAKYRVAAKTRNYSDVLRDVIATQMEYYSEAQNGDPTNDSHDLNKSKTDKLQQHKDADGKRKSLEQDKTYSREKKSNRNSQKECEHRYRDESRHRRSSRDKTQHRDSSRDEKRHRDSSKDETRRRDNPRDETRHRDNFRDEARHTDSPRDRYKDKVMRYDDYKRNNPRDDERNRRDGGDKHSSSSKDRSRDRKDYRTSGTHLDDSREFKKEYKDYKSSRYSEVGHKREDDSYKKSYREEKHKRYYDYKQDDFEVRKCIKQEKDRINYV